MASTTKSPRHFLRDLFWKFAQRGPTKTLNKGALKHRTWGKDGFNNQASKAFVAGYLLGNLHKEEQQGHSTREPLSTELRARMASTTKGPRHFLQDIFGN